MENENKNTPQQQNAGGQKNNSHRRKPHKSKAYYITPENTAPQNVNASAPAQKSADAPKQEAHKPHHRPNKNVQHKEQPKATPEQKSQAPEQTAMQNKPAKNKPRHKAKPQQDVAQQHNNPKQNNDKATQSSAKQSIKAQKPDRLEMPIRKVEKPSSPDAKYADYDEFTYDELYGNIDMPITEPPAPVNSEAEKEQKEASEQVEDKEVEVVGIRFKAGGKTYYFEPCGIKLGVGKFAIVKTARGLEYGEVALANTFVKESETVPPLRPVVREANTDDVAHHADNKRKEDDAFRLCNEKIIEHGLDMKLIDAQYTFDNSKLLFYFTSSGRVDFRELVKDLASVFRTRIELRQIGIRDEAKMVGGLGPCGRSLCCSLFLSDFGQVSIKMAKDQNISLNASKISGICGRLMCCLRYEHEAYEYEIKRTPPVDTIVRTVDGVGVVVEISPIAGTIRVKLHEPNDIPPKTYKRNEVTILKKKKQ